VAARKERAKQALSPLRQEGSQYPIRRNRVEHCAEPLHGQKANTQPGVAQSSKIKTTPLAAAGKPLR
jgi:hypothetical protein